MVLGSLKAPTTQTRSMKPLVLEEEDDPRVGGQWRIATLSRRGKCSPAAGLVLGSLEAPTTQTHITTA